MAEIKRAQQLDPLSAVIGKDVGNVYVLLGDLNSAVTEYKKAIELDPNFPRAHGELGSDYLQLGQEHEPLDECTGELNCPAGERVAELSRIRLRSGRKACGGRDGIKRPGR